jgi:methylated-DNA-[protein]-cysteine S-methyltransferase
MPYRTYNSPVGVLTLVATDTGLSAVWWPEDSRTTELGEEQPEHPVLEQAARELDEYFAGARRRFDITLEPRGTAFQQAAWQVLRQIPYGTTISYAEQARRLGDPAKARAAGAADGRNPLSIIVPCHRVVATSGALTGFAGGVEAKSWLLTFEREHAAAHPVGGVP